MLNLLKGITLCVLSAACFHSQAVSLSTYRIYLDQDDRTESFIMYNRTVFSEECSLSLVHNNFDVNGNMTKVADDIVPKNSAKPWIRFSPKNFTVEAKAPQTVRFTLRRRANTEANEYRSYLRVDCTPISPVVKSSSHDSEHAKMTLRPKLIQQIPIIARTGKMSALLSFDNIEVKNNTVAFDMIRTGKRSVYGKVELLNHNTGEVIRYNTNISIYPEVGRESKTFPLKNNAPEDLTLRFTEDKTHKNSLVYEQRIIPEL